MKVRQELAQNDSAISGMKRELELKVMIGFDLEESNQYMMEALNAIRYNNNL